MRAYYNESALLLEADMLAGNQDLKETGNYSTNNEEDRLGGEVKELGQCQSWSRGSAIPVKFWKHLNLS